MKFERFEQIHCGFMLRDFSLKSIGITEQYALEEIIRLRACCCETDYYRLSRVGSTFQLSRKGRMLIWRLRENAKNHASIEDEMREAGVL